MLNGALKVRLQSLRLFSKDSRWLAFWHSGRRLMRLYLPIVELKGRLQLMHVYFLFCPSGISACRVGSWLLFFRCIRAWVRPSSSCLLGTVPFHQAFLGVLLCTGSVLYVLFSWNMGGVAVFPLFLLLLYSSVLEWNDFVSLAVAVVGFLAWASLCSFPDVSFGCLAPASALSWFAFSRSMISSPTVVVLYSVGFSGYHFCFPTRAYHHFICLNMYISISTGGFLGRSLVRSPYITELRISDFHIMILILRLKALLRNISRRTCFHVFVAFWIPPSAALSRFLVIYLFS